MSPIQSSANLGGLSWSAGTPAEEIFTLGNFQNSFGFQNLSLSDIEQITGQSLSDSSLANFNLVQSLSVEELTAAIPGLADLPVSASSAISSIANQQGIDTIAGNATIGEIASKLDGTIGQLDLTNFAISDIPGLSDTALSQLPDWANAKIADVPGLSQIPLINPFSLKDYFVPFDIGFGMSPCNLGAECREFDIDNTASGNWENMSIPCEGGPCAHIEVKRWGNDTNKIRWVSKEQKVPGGNGFLCTEEPTGRFPFGKNPKVVVENVKEEPGEVEFALYFYVEGPFELESAHCIGPFPMPFWGNRKEGELILFGPDTASATTPFTGSARTKPVSGSDDTEEEITPETPPSTGVECEGGSTSGFIRPTSGPVTSPFGWRIHPITRTRRFHEGVDFGDGLGTSIAASNCGTVSYADWMSGYGNYTCILHGKGLETCYGHQSKIFVRKGQKVKKGEIIGKVGSTGNSTGPHLHFEVRVGGEARDPMDYL
jgi:hypothetical protein